MTLLFLSIALAADPVVERLDDSWVQAHVDIEATPDEVWALIAKPNEVAAVSKESVARATPDGDCLRVFTIVDHPITRAEYTARACPDGEYAIRQTLVDGDMKEFESRWWVEPRGEASTLHYKIRAIPRYMVPQFMVDRATAKSVDRTLARIRDHVEDS